MTCAGVEPTASYIFCFLNHRFSAIVFILVFVSAGVSDGKACSVFFLIDNDFGTRNPKDSTSSRRLSTDFGAGSNLKEIILYDLPHWAAKKFSFNF